MKPLRSLLFYAPILLLFAVDSASQDIGLWSRYTVVSLLGLYGVWRYRKSMGNGLSTITLMVLALVISVVKIGTVSADSELYAFVARMTFLAGWILIAKGAFSENEGESKAALAVGAQAALWITGLSLLPDLVSAYKEDNIYLATGAFFTHKNYAAATLLLLTPMAMLGRLDANWGRWLQRSALALSMILIVFLKTRGVWLGAVAMAATTAVYYIVQKEKRYGKLSLQVMVVLVVGIGAATFAGGAEKIFNSSTIQTRLHYWNASWEMYMENPISGVGGGQWKVEYPGTGLKGTNESVMNGSTSILRPHNDLLWMLSETGTMGGAFFIGILAVGFVSALKKSNLPMALVVVGFAVYGFGEFPLERATLLWPLALASGASAASMKPTLPSKALPLVAGVLLLFTATVSMNRVSGEREAKQVIDAYMKKDTRAMLKHAELAPNTFFQMDIFNNPVVYFEGLAYLMSQGGQNPGPQMLKKAETKFKEALDIHPYHMMSMEKLAVVHQFHGNYAAASTLYSDILSFSPRNLQAALGLMESSRAEGDLHTAMIALEKIDLKYTPANNGALRNQGVATLQAFARSNNPRKVFADLHQNLQGKGQKQMWDTWVSWRVKRRELAQKQANAK